MAGQAVGPLSATVARHRALRVPGRTAWAAAGLSLVAAWVHFSYTAPHWRDWWAYGVFFLAMGVFQAACAPAIVRWPRNTWVALVAIAGNLGIVGMYVYSRTVEIPMGPHAGIVEKATAIDLATTAAEIMIVAIVLTVVGSRSRRVILNLLLLAGIGLWVLRLTTQVLWW
ncbi:MAG TPA: hypothetical protein VHF51_00750 [Solirubrobacteraceae bacterium]|nr:hypothetical protein [Solirubrobacteraceae bacterium]